MAYVSLYRKYRPRTFDEVVGQEHVTRTLRNAIDEGRLAHAYLFTGPRGTGKTSTARILAAALNCESGPTSTPCGDCDHCTSISGGSSVDVIELDMASHGGVDDARELRDRALFAPATARRKVYILDEVHMASTAAFNALLKLIEEPPDHVLFAMATTDPQKVIPTILSRVQRLDLRRVAASTVAAHVREVCDNEGATIEEGALEAVVRSGDGSVRDTLSVLEQVLAFAGGDAGGGATITTAAVAQTLGTTPAQRLLETVELLAARDVAGLFALVQQLVDDGHDLRRFSLELVGHVRDLLVAQVAPDRPDLIDATDEHRERLVAQSSLLPRATLLRAVTVLSGALAEQRQGSPRLPLELALATLAVPGADGDVAELADRVARIESGSAPVGNGNVEVAAADPAARSTPPATSRPLASGPDAPDAAAPAAQGPDLPAAAGSNDTEDAEATESTSATTQVPPAEAPAEEDTADASDGRTPPVASAGDDAAEAPAGEGPGDALATVRAQWSGVLELLKQRSRRYHAIFEPAEPREVRRDILVLRYGPRYVAFHAVQARTQELSDALTAAIEHACGLRLKVEVTTDDEPGERRPVPPSVTPDDARTPVLDNPPQSDQPDDADDAEGAEVREAELGDKAGEVDVDELLRSELGARLVDERPPSSES